MGSSERIWRALGAGAEDGARAWGGRWEHDAGGVARVRAGFGWGFACCSTRLARGGLGGRGTAVGLLAGYLYF